ncbi:MAG: peptidylprolyl isomerase [Synechococcales cyanobacterium T60_A2020_003]|nr:peptidylprolyl isomerase [Synechococcales cyanobacterium T60_A2020_003]
MSIVVNAIKNVTVAKNAKTDSINLFKQFDDPFTTGLVAQFKLYDSSLGGGVSRVVLFDQKGKGAPLTVQNFASYVEDGAYKKTFIHRSIPGFIIQCGGFTVDGTEEAIANGDPSQAISVIPTDDPVKNEFSSKRSNLRGTIAMAKLPDDPDSATSQWFFNLRNNSTNLDNQNGGFTVFGAVMSEKDLAPIDAIAKLERFDARGFFQQGAFDTIPFIDPPDNANNSTDENFVRYRNITINSVDELKFKVVGNSNPTLVDATINNRGRLILDYGRNETGQARITVRATNLLGEAVKDTFRVTVNDSLTQGGVQLQSLSGRSLETNLVVGTVKNDELLGTAANETFEAKSGKDTITTGRGADIIRIGLTDAVDTVTDFEDGRDRIELTGSLSFNDLTIRQRDDQTNLSVNGDRFLVLENAIATDLTAVDFG